MDGRICLNNPLGLAHGARNWRAPEGEGLSVVAEDEGEAEAEAEAEAEGDRG